MEDGTFSPPAVILAGGRATRMGGQDKALIALAGRPMVDHVIDRLLPQVGPIAINSNGDPARFGRKRPVIADGIEDHPGPLAGILAAMDWAQALKSEWVLTVATDTPFLPAGLVARLAQAQVVSRAPIVLAETPDGLQPVTGLWHVPLSDSLRGSIEAGTRKVMDFAEAKGAVSAVFATEDFFNVNTPADLAVAESRLQR
ncbi:molybdenum cofactor guanylyltransferase MobA [Maritimibacter sp. UBA3975]|uniref:molybdenum cofactor guanylyltransferase MobA n=1 Tax=Maritimibacter sp. UBA3975 TaxID=1946833 RepID=UPI000C09B7BF|nr:molybdenum cofactor guanylyltransferase MobA [Maritimibacter sp. UBA3975]MAM63656.1 molybdenum cofactor guanylyltransferase MobA [Maritimibacter sp.]|tara:strand:+ start:5772 stop:6371 length:600 start_codon:yes stop_codon:yes gene_type:complete